MNTAIAQHLNVAESAIVEIQEWARVLWVRVKGLGARFVSKKVVNVCKLADRIKELSQPSGREAEILDLFRLNKKMPKENRIALNQEFKPLEKKRKQRYQEALNEAWSELKNMGYARYDVRGNAAYESGHSDYEDEGSFYRAVGISAPDGKDFQAKLYWHESIVHAAIYAGI